MTLYVMSRERKSADPVAAITVAGDHGTAIEQQHSFDRWYGRRASTRDSRFGATEIGSGSEAIRIAAYDPNRAGRERIISAGVP